MPSEIKAVVFKTAMIQATRAFFEHTLHIPIRESSIQHFVIYSKGIRLIFVSSEESFEVEMYLEERVAGSIKQQNENPTNTPFISQTDPNGIRVIQANNNRSQLNEKL